MSTETQYEEHIAAATALGKEHAENAASWVTDGNASEEHYRYLLTMFDDGDPALVDMLPREPNLSGEWADELTPAELYRDITGDDPPVDDMTSERELAHYDAILNAYEAAVSEHFQAACERNLRAALA